MRYYLDTEFDGYGGDLISLALVRQDCDLDYVLRGGLADDGALQRRRSLYLVTKGHARDPWVKEHVIPLLNDVPPLLRAGRAGIAMTLPDHIPLALAGFLLDDPTPIIVADWPDDIARLCVALITGPGTMIESAKSLRFRVERVDAYPTTLPGAVQHNAWWDAMALRHMFEGDADR